VSRRTRTIALLIIATGASLLGDSTLYAVLPSSYASAGIAATAVGLILSANRLVRLLTNSLVGSGIDRMGRRRPFMLGMALAVASTLAYGYSSSLALLLSARVVWGLAWSLIAVSGHSMVLDLSTDRDRGRLVGLYRGLVFLGGSLGMLAGGVLLDSVGFHRTFLLLGLVTGAGFLAGLGLVETAPASAARRPTALPDCRSEENAPTSRRPLKLLAQMDRRLWTAAGLNLLTRFFISGVLVSTLGLYLAGLSVSRSAGIDLTIGTASLTGALLFLRSLLSIGSSPAFGHLTDRSGSRFRVMVLGLALGAAGFGFLALGAGLWSILVGVVLTALSDGALPTAAAALVGDISAENRRGAAVAIYATVGDLGAGLAPLTAYALASAWGLEDVYAACAGTMLASLLILAWAARRGYSAIDSPP
jgi:MFS family permease